MSYADQPFEFPGSLSDTSDIEVAYKAPQISLHRPPNPASRAKKNHYTSVTRTYAQAQNLATTASILSSSSLHRSSRGAPHSQNPRHRWSVIGTTTLKTPGALRFMPTNTSMLRPSCRGGNAAMTAARIAGSGSWVWWRVMIQAIRMEVWDGMAARGGYGR